VVVGVVQKRVKLKLLWVLRHCLWQRLDWCGFALEVSLIVLPAQRTKFTKRQFSQPQLLAVLCLMRYEDWTFREAEVRLSEHAELRSALELNSVPDYTTLYAFWPGLIGTM